MVSGINSPCELNLENVGKDTLPKTNLDPENGPFLYKRVVFRFSGSMLVFHGVRELGVSGVFIFLDQLGFRFVLLYRSDCW